MNMRLIFSTLLFLNMFHSMRADIELAAAPSAYATSWQAFDDQDQLVTQGTFQPDDISFSTGFQYATIPNGVASIVVTSQGYRFDNGPVLDFETETTIDNPQDDSTYTLKKVDDQIQAILSE